MAQLSYKTETDVLHLVARDPSCRWLPTRHAAEQMAARGILITDVQFALTVGHVELVERKADDVWRVRGRDLDGNALMVACVVFEDTIAIRIITAF